MRRRVRITTETSHDAPIRDAPSVVLLLLLVVVVCPPPPIVVCMCGVECACGCGVEKGWLSTVSDLSLDDDDDDALRDGRGG